LVSKPRSCSPKWNMPRSRMDWSRSWSHPSTQWWSKQGTRRVGPGRRWTGEYGYRACGMQWHSCNQQICRQIE
jgi:hypothetical protein